MSIKKHVYHIRSVKKIEKNVILCGKKSRVKLVGERFLEDAKLLEDDIFFILRGKYKGLSIDVVSTGIGAASVGIAVQELIALGGRNLIRVGTCGRLNKNLKVGDILLVAGAVRNDGLTEKIAPLGYPALSDPLLYSLLMKSARASGNKIYHILEKTNEENAIYYGIADTKSDFFLEVPISANNKKILEEWEALKNLGVAVSSMECAVIFIKAKILEQLIKEPIRAASILVVVGDALSESLYSKDTRDLERSKRGEEKAIKIALETFCLLEKFNF